MITVGAFEAKSHLSNLLDKVSNGEEVLITKRGKAIARLVSEKAIQKEKIDKVIEELKALREEFSLDGLDWRELRDMGRK